MLFVCELSLLEGFFLHIVVVFPRWVQMPYVALSREIRVIKEPIAWLTTNLSSCVVSERILQQLVIRPYKCPAVSWRVLPGIVDQHRRIHAFPDSLLKILQSFSELSRVFRHAHNTLQLLSSNPNILMIIVRIASVFVDGPLSFSTKNTSK